MPIPKLEDAEEVVIKLDVVRDGSAEDIYDAISTALDEAQAAVFAKMDPYAYVVIKVVP